MKEEQRERERDKGRVFAGYWKREQESKRDHVNFGRSISNSRPYS
jgi:hypothetical protein